MRALPGTLLVLLVQLALASQCDPACVHGMCVDGVCQCTGGLTGPTCSDESMLFSPSAAWQNFFAFTISGIVFGISVVKVYEWSVVHGRAYSGYNATWIFLVVTTAGTFANCAGAHG